jgi:hypothetical protein
MAQLKPGTPLRTREAQVECPPDLPPGNYRALLVVHSRRHGDSEPAEIRIRVVRRAIGPGIGGVIGGVIGPGVLTPVPPVVVVPSPPPIRPPIQPPIRPPIAPGPGIAPRPPRPRRPR